MDDAVRRLDEVRARGLGDTGRDWQEPEPLNAPTEDGADFPVSALGDLQALIMEIVTRRKVPEALAATCVLSVSSYAVQGIYDVQTLFGSSPISLYMLTSAVSGERKSAVDKMLTRGVKAAATEIHKQNKREAEMSTALGEVAPEMPSANLIHGDVTMEGLTSAFQHGQPSLYACTDEGGSQTGGHTGKAENRLKYFADMSRLFGGGHFSQTRRGQGRKPEVMLLKERRLGVHLMGQPAIMAGLYADPVARDQGVMARFLVSQPKSKIGTRIESLADAQNANVTPECDAFSERVKEKVLAMKRPDIEDNIERPIIRLSDDAMQLVLRFSNEIETEMGAGRSLFRHRATANKMPEQACRIAGVLAGFAGDTQVSAEVMTNAITLATYFLGESVRLAEASPDDAAAAYCERIAKRLMSRGGSMRRLDLLKNSPKPRPNAKRLDAYLDRLAEAGWIRIEGHGSARNIILNPFVRNLLGGERGEK